MTAPLAARHRRVFPIAFLALGLFALNLSAQGLAAGARPSQPAPPVPPLPRCPVAEFRTWLSLSPVEQEAVLASRRPEQREVLRRKLLEYAQLPVDERELRFQVIELHWYLKPLLTIPVELRAETLASVPEALRPLLKRRLTEWDAYSSVEQARVLQSDLGDLLRLGRKRPSPPSPPPPPPPLPEGRLAVFTPAAQGALVDRFARLFQLDDRDRERVLEQLPEEDRARTTQFLSQLAKIPPAQRQKFIDGFRKLCELPAPERDRFMRQYERWQSLTPEEKQVWRRMFHRIPPAPVPPATSPQTAATSTNAFLQAPQLPTPLGARRPSITAARERPI